MRVRKIVGVVLSFIGGFLIVLGVLAQFYAPGQLMKTPLDVNSTTYLDGEAELANGTGGTDTFPVRAFSVTQSDSEKSTSDIVLWQNSTCLVKDEGGIEGCVSADDPEKRLLSATTDTFATSRTTALAVQTDLLPASAEDKEGLVNKWPFEAEKKTYPFWDSNAGEAVDAVFDREEELDGLNTYVYKVDINDVPVEISDGVPGTFSRFKEIYVEPLTGSIIKQVDQQLKLDEKGDVFLSVDLSYTDEQVANGVKDAEDNRDQLNLITSTVPLIGYLAGIPLLLIGLALTFLGSRRRGDEDEEEL